MICPKCGSGNEMLFSVLSVSFVCNEAPCGFELEVDTETAEVESLQDAMAASGGSAW